MIKLDCEFVAVTKDGSANVFKEMIIDGHNVSYRTSLGKWYNEFQLEQQTENISSEIEELHESWL